MDRKCNHSKWDALTTVKRFDLGNHINGEFDDTYSSDTQLDVVSPDVGTPISLLVQSLVQQLCTMLEKDGTRANQLYNSICEKLHNMKLIDESYSMGEFEVMRSQYQHALYQLVSVASGSEIPFQLPITWPIIQPSGLEWSRYHREFEELFFIAGGGFGSVFKARHRLDGVEYAVKKICIRSSNINKVMNHLAEVKTIASLNHPNIVSYKAAWLEPLLETKRNKKEDIFNMEMETGPINSYSKRNFPTFPSGVHTFKTHNSNELEHSDAQSDFRISFHDSKSCDDDACSENSEVLSDSSEESHSKGIDNKQKIICKQYQMKKCSQVNLKWATLFIQMSFCQKTLKEWLEERNQSLTLRLPHCDSDISIHSSSPNMSIPYIKVIDHVSPSSSPPTNDMKLEWCSMDHLIDMFTKLVKGLHYIHSRGIVHHDIKPSNVFVGFEGDKSHVQLGDFGLACPLQQSHNGMALGTHLYAAPEQLEGQCNPKSDMYSLGILLLEMVECFRTDMERVKTINDLRKGQIPAQLTANYPKIAHIIGKLVQRRPGKRLDSEQLLEELRQLSEDKDVTIRALREELASKDDEILKLKMMLAKAHSEV